MRGGSHHVGQVERLVDPVGPPEEGEKLNPMITAGPAPD
jgi:hypothetical protein